MSLGNCYLIAFIVFALNVVIGGEVCEALSISPSISYALGFASLFVILPLLLFVETWIDGRRGR